MRWRSVAVPVLTVCAAAALFLALSTLFSIIAMRGNPGRVGDSVPIPGRTLDITGGAARGASGAPVVIVEYSDFACPFCKAFARDVLPVLTRDYVDRGTVRLVFKHFPLSDLHPTAHQAAEGAECARRQGAFWPMHDGLFRADAAQTKESIEGLAKTIGLDPRLFGRCLSGDARSEVDREIDEGEALMVQGTPTFFIGTVEVDGRLRVDRTLAGALPVDRFVEAIEAEMPKGR